MIKVDPAAINEVSSVGRVVTRTSADPVYERIVQGVEILVLDVDASDFTEALSVARGRLQQHGWTVSSQDDVTVFLKKGRWYGTTARLGRLEDLDSFGARLEPGAEKALQADSVKSSSYILVSVSRDE
ncbi:hypothetical protein [Nonomuraea sp. 10N515B]|uniref:hypothetical protein n=1 Tax=Nonomuraea sp. 10N515B TaxID=3457422 RepID=UPI003FCC569D